MRENSCTRGAWQQGIREKKHSVWESMLSLEICRETSCFPPGSQLHCIADDVSSCFPQALVLLVILEHYCNALHLYFLCHWMYCSLFLLLEVHGSYLIIILSTTAELLMCGKALPRINMIAFLPSSTILLSALINLSYTYFGLTFSLIGQESTEEYTGTRIMPYYGKGGKKG